MYRKTRVAVTGLEINQAEDGETMEQKIERIIHNNEPITDGAPRIFTERKDGVLPDYNIRTDRFEIAVDAMDKIAKSKIANRENKGKIVKLNQENDKKTDGGTEPTQGTDGN